MSFDRTSRIRGSVIRRISLVTSTWTEGQRVVVLYKRKAIARIHFARWQVKISNQWFHGFKKHYNISLRQPTLKAQVVPSSKSELIQKFHRDIRAKAATGNQLGPLGRFRLSCIADMDQTPSPFSFTNGPTYESKGASTVWVQGGSSGLWYDRRVGVSFQENVRCDKPTMIHWVKQYWKPHIQGPTLLCLDQHKAQKTPSIESLLAVDCNTTTALYHPGVQA